MIFLTRRYRFCASHRLHSLLLSEAENRRLYGKCNNPFGHGHDYVLEVTITGELNPLTGLLMPTAALDSFVADKILRHFSYRNINADVPEFATGLVPTTENLVRVVANMISAAWPQAFSGLGVRVAKIHIQETDRNGFELLLAALAENPISARRNESVMVNA